VSNYTGIGNNLSSVVCGNGTIGGVLIINDISGARQAIGTANYNLTFFKHNSIDSRYYQTFQIVGGSSSSTGATAYNFNIGTTTRFRINSSGQTIAGTVNPTYATLGTFNITSPSGSRLVLLNSSGGIGSGNQIDFYTYDLSGGVEPGLRISSYDTNYSADMIVSTKIPNSASNALTERFRIWNNGGIRTLGFAQSYHLRGGTSAPTLSTNTGAGTNSSSSLTLATDMAGRVSVTIGNSPATASPIFTVTFNVQYSAAPIIIMTPANAAASALSGAQNVYVYSTSTTNFIVYSGTNALATGTTYIWNYHAIQ
jgi:hypothetical protein